MNDTDKILQTENNEQRILLFTAPGCPKCPAARERVKAEGIDVDIIQVDSDETRALAFKYRVRSVPAFILLSRNGEYQATTIEEIINETGTSIK